MKVMTMVMGGMGNNTYFVIGDDGKSTVIIDPAYEPERIIEYVSGQDWILRHCWLPMVIMII